MSRKKKPPYEIMRGRARRPSTPAPVRQSEEEPSVAAPPPEQGEEIGFWAQLRHPIVLRLPRGYAFLLAALLMLLLGLAYWVGHQRGLKSGRIEAEDLPLLGYGEAQGRDVDWFFFYSYAQGKWPKIMPAHGPDDPRRKGMLYMRLGEYSQVDAMGVVTLLREWGFAGFGVSGENNRFAVYTAREFKPQDQDTQRYRDYQTRLRELADDKSVLMRLGGVQLQVDGLELYTGPPGEPTP